MRELVTARRVAVTLVGVIALSAVLRFALAWWLPVPWIFADELIYSELAKSLAATGTFSVRDVPGLGYGPLYPILISPAYALFDSVPHAYLAIKAINSLVMSCAAVPVYFLARRLLSRGWAIAVASLSVAIPSLVYTGMVMTESLYYPVFLATVLAIVRMAERPTAYRQLLVVALVALGPLIRFQAVLLVPALLTAVALVSVGDVVAEEAGAWPSELRKRLWVYRPTFISLAGCLAALAAWEWGRGRSLSASFGTAAGVWSQDYSAGAVARWFVYHVAELDLYAGVLPFAALLVLATFTFARSDRSIRVVAAVSVSTSFWLLLVVSAYVSSLAHSQAALPHIEDRYTFYLVPLLLIALAAWCTQRLPRSRSFAGIVGVIAGLLPLVIPFKRLIRNDAIPDTFALLPWAEVRAHRLTAPPDILIRVGVVTLALGLLFFLLSPPRLPFVAPLLVVLNFAGIMSAAEIRTHGASLAAARSIRADHDWIDRSVGSGADTVVLWRGRADSHAIWENEFFNRSVGTIYYLAGPTGIGLAEQHARVDRAGRLYADGSTDPVQAEYLLADRSVVPRRGRLVAIDHATGMRLFATDSRGGRSTVEIARP